MECQIAIIGSGFSGLGMGIRLKQEGIDDFLILERRSDVGGVWRDASYPGCACDVPSPLYSFSFAPNPSWSRKYSPQGEILSYLKRCAEDFGLRPQIKTNCELIRADWDGHFWNMQTSQGPLRARILISGTGAFSEIAYPDIPGLETFGGAVFHSAAWDHSYDLRGKRVAVIGTGASSIQFLPQIQKIAAHLTLFQRSAPWIIPRLDRPVPLSRQKRYRLFPFFLQWKRLRLYLMRELMGISFRRDIPRRIGRLLAEWQLNRQIKDPGLRKKLRPQYPFGCKRVLVSDDYYPALTKANVRVECEPIASIDADGIRVKGASQSEKFDAILLGTGYRVSDFPIAARIFNQEGKALNDFWQGSPSAFLGTSISGYPNLFALLGPNTGLGHSSVILMIEAQIAWVLKAIQYARKQGFESLVPNQDAFVAYQNEVDQHSARTVWVKGGCQSWYLDRNGRNSTLWPRSIGAFRRRTRFNPADCDFLPVRET